jgi:hypothetical protein
MRPACLDFVFLLLRENCLQNVAGLGNMGEIDFRGNPLGAATGC